jgi:predicted transport protein
MARHYAAFAPGKHVSGDVARALAKLRHLVDVPAILVMTFRVLRKRRYDRARFYGCDSLTESYIVRRAVCGYQTRGYWQIFASLAYKVREKESLNDLKVALARQRENYRFPSDEEFERALKETDLYGMQVCRHLLEGLANHETKEPTDTTGYSIEHFFLEILPRRYRLTLLLGLEFNEIDEPTGLAQDATQWKFLVHARNEGGVTFRVADDSTLEAALPLIRQAYAGASE